MSPTHGEQENSVWNGHYACTCYHPLFVFNQFGDLERCTLRPGNVHSADGEICPCPGKPIVDLGLAIVTVGHLFDFGWKLFQFTNLIQYFFIGS